MLWSVMSLIVYTPLPFDMQPCNTSHLLGLSDIYHLRPFLMLNCTLQYCLTAFHTSCDPSNPDAFCKLTNQLTCTLEATELHWSQISSPPRRPFVSYLYPSSKSKRWIFLWSLPCALTHICRSAHLNTVTWRAVMIRCIEQPTAIIPSHNQMFTCSSASWCLKNHWTYSNLSSVQYLREQHKQEKTPINNLS